MEKSLSKFGAGRSILIDKNNRIIAGNKTTENFNELGLEKVTIIDTDRDTLIAVRRNDIDLDTPEGREFALADNQTAKVNIDFDFGTLEAELEDGILEEWGIENPEEEVRKEQNKKLSDRFIIPPFSVLDTKQGAWQQRKNYWLSLGIKSELGRDAGSNASIETFKGKKYSDILSEQTSIFDPVLCELSYHWFNVPNGNILDPFAGGSVRGIVASKLGFNYLGNDLRKEQIEANRANAKEVLGDDEIYPTWTDGDSLNIDKLAKGYEADMIFSCPPYADLEKYSDLKEDISNMPYDDFIKIYSEIIKKSCDKLKQNRFAVFVVGDVRDKKGFYQNFVSDTISAFIDCGVFLYNEMILATQIGNTSLTTSRNFPIGRKVGKVHQNVLVFFKGDPKTIKGNYPELDLSYIEEQTEE